MFSDFPRDKNGGQRSSSLSSLITHPDADEYAFVLFFNSLIAVDDAFSHSWFTVWNSIECYEWRKGLLESVRDQTNLQN